MAKRHQTEHGKKREVRQAGENIRRSILMLLMVFAAVVLAACGTGGREDTADGGSRPVGDGRFTVEADGERWQPADGEDEEGTSGAAAFWELVLTEDRTVRISFVPTEGITKEMVTEFETSFADGYMETLKEEYPDIRRTDIRQVDDVLAGIGMTMTDRVSGSRMCQFLYLASDGKNGYMITAAFPQNREAALKQEVMKVIESFHFTETGE